MFSIAVVVASGVMTVVTMRGTYWSLDRALNQYYHEYRLADLWSGLKRAPERVRLQLAGIPGVMTVQTRVSFSATLDLPGLDAPAIGRFVSVPEQRTPMLNDLHITDGRYIAPGRPDEVMLSRKFAIANALAPGDTIHAVINGARRALTVVGIAMSPEYGYAVPPGSLFPDDTRFGVLWMSRRELGPAYDMDGAFNDVAVQLAPGANRAQVITDVDRILEPYGGVGAYGRDRQMSAKALTDEIASGKVMGTMIPAVFLAVAAFLLHLVLGRLITTQRTELAVLKAFGYRDTEVATHYLTFALAAVLGGAVVGTILGVVLGGGMISVYKAYFEMPSVEYQLNWVLVAIGVGVSGLAAVIGALGAVRKAVALPPAEAMRPEPPARFEPGLLERSGLGSLLPTAGRMILRNIERHTAKTVFSAIGVACSVAILVIGLFMFDGISRMMELQFRVGQREDLSVTFTQPLSATVGHDLAALDGVTRTELFRTVPVRLTADHRVRNVGLTGMPAASELRQIVTARGGIQPLPPEGMVLSSMLAEELHVAVGDSVVVQVMEGQRRTAHVAISGVVDDFIGLSSYMQRDALDRLVGGSPMVSGAYLRAEAPALPALQRTMKRLPTIASVASPAEMHAAFQTQLSSSLFVAIGFLVGFSAVIAVAVIYNGARIALSERGRELASLRVLGFTRGEVATILLGEQAVITLLAVPVGWGLGYLLAGVVSAGLRSELYRIPLVVSGTTYLWSALIAMAAALASGLLVRRRLNTLDLIAVLKTRE